jgi:hypothetical protein
MRIPQWKRSLLSRTRPPSVSARGSGVGHAEFSGGRVCGLERGRLNGYQEIKVPIPRKTEGKDRC